MRRKTIKTKEQRRVEQLAKLEEFTLLDDTYMNAFLMSSQNSCSLYYVS